jgi:hypothetical protein
MAETQPLKPSAIGLKLIHIAMKSPRAEDCDDLESFENQRERKVSGNPCI